MAPECGLGHAVVVMRSHRGLGWCALFAFAVGGCAVTETGNPGFTMAAIGSDSLLIGPADNADTIEEAWVALGSLDLAPFVPGEGCQLDGALPILDEPRAINLFGGAVDQNVPPGAYCHLSMLRDSVAAESLPPGAPPELASANMVIRGRRADGTPYVVINDVSRTTNLPIWGTIESFDVRTEDHFIISWDFGIILAMPVNLDDLVPGPDGVIRISSTENAALLDAINGFEEESVGLLRDLDRDGVLDIEEENAYLVKGNQ